jgi:hypothetical protein
LTFYIFYAKFSFLSLKNTNFVGLTTLDRYEHTVATHGRETKQLLNEDFIKK